MATAPATGDGGGGDGDGMATASLLGLRMSIFHPRVKESDSRSMFDTACHKRAFKSDWAKCLEKGDRF